MTARPKRETAQTIVDRFSALMAARAETDPETLYKFASSAAAELAKVANDNGGAWDRLTEIGLAAGLEPNKLQQAFQIGQRRGKRAANDNAVRFVLTPFAEMRPDPAAHCYLIKGVLPRQGLIVVWGPPKCGKSFWVFDLVMHVALGRYYRQRRVTRGEVVYLALEGQAGFPDRKEAFCRRYLYPGDTDPAFSFCGGSLDLIKDHAKLIADIKAQSARPSCVVIDTLNRSLAGSENDPEDMAAYVRAADAIQRAFGCVVVVIHHCGVNGERPRGHTALTGAADVQIAVRKDAAGVVMSTVELAKDMPEGATFMSRLESEEVGSDPDGDPITSCVVVAVDGVTTQKAQSVKEPASCRTFRAAFAEAIDATGQDIAARAGSPNVRAARVADVRAEFDRRYATGETDPKKRADARRKAFTRSLEKLASEYPTFVVNDEEWVCAQ